MSVREEERQKNNCPSRGLGLAAAAIGVGVGAALYYFFNKRPENPDNEGSTSSNWVCEEPQALKKTDRQHPKTMSANESTLDHSFMDEDDYITVSEHSTTDTSITSETPTEFTISDSSEESSTPNSNDSSFSTESPCNIDSSVVYVSDSDLNDEWDVTNDSVDMPTDTMERSPVHALFNSIIDLLSPATEYARNRFRQRSWSLEECSICCEVMLKDQELEELPCAHSFHAACVRPWLNEQRTCPNCRKLA